MYHSQLAKIRTNAGKTQYEVAESLGITYQAYAHYEKGRREPSPEQLLKLADYFGVSVDSILGRTDFTPEERAAGFSDTKRVLVTPKEDIMLEKFRAVGIKHGEDAQDTLIAVADKML